MTETSNVVEALNELYERGRGPRPVLAHLKNAPALVGRTRLTLKAEHFAELDAMGWLGTGANGWARLTKAGFRELEKIANQRLPETELAKKRRNG